MHMPVIIITNNKYYIKIKVIYHLENGILNGLSLKY